MFAYACVPNASFLMEHDHKGYELWPNYKVEAAIPSCMNNTLPILSLEDKNALNDNGRIKMLYEEHAAVQGKYCLRGSPLVGKNPTEQSLIN